MWVTIQSNVRVLNLSSTVSNHSQNVPLITSTFKLLLNKNSTNDRYSYNTSNNTGLRTDLYVQERERDTRTQSRVCRHPVGRSCTGLGTRSRRREREGDLGGGTLTQSHSPCCNNQSLEITIEASKKKVFSVFAIYLIPYSDTKYCICSQTQIISSKINCHNQRLCFICDALTRLSENSYLMLRKGLPPSLNCCLHYEWRWSFS